MILLFVFKMDDGVNENSPLFQCGLGSLMLTLVAGATPAAAAVEGDRTSYLRQPEAKQ